MDEPEELTIQISIHVPAWGTTSYSCRNLISPSFQSTFPRGERHRSSLTIFNVNSISIHVPAWGTTNVSLYFLWLRFISIHVPAWGTTNGENNAHKGMIYFNPRSRVGNDHSIRQSAGATGHFNPRSRVGNDYLRSILPVTAIISIHVPAWGTTTGIVTSVSSGSISIHVPAWGTTGYFILF